MAYRFLVLLAALVFAPSIGLTPGLVIAQSEDGASGFPRTPEGRPDFTGLYDVATMTPVERPAEFEGRLFLTDEEVAEMVQYEELRNQRDLAPLDPNREAPPVGGDTSPTNSYLEGLFRLGGGTVGGYNLFWLSPGERPVTIDRRARTSLVVDPEDGRVPPMRADARERMAALLARSAAPDAGEAGGGGAGPQYDAADRRPLAERCILGFGSTSGPPTLPNYFYNNLKFIVQNDDWVMIYNEMVHDTRMIRIEGASLSPKVQQWMGSSVGRWEGDTLVVETSNFTNKTRFRGSGEALTVTERFSPGENGTILYRFTVDDPSTWGREWTGEYPWNRSDETIYEYACHEGNYALDTVLRGARLADREAGAGR